MERLNKAQAMDIFTRNAVLIDDRDVLPMDRALELLGYSAMSYIADRHTIERPLYGRYDVGGLYSVFDPGGVYAGCDL